MSDIHKAFENGKALIACVTCGDPSLETTGAIVRAMDEAGADMAVLGIPFSDPTVEGPDAQKANARALSGGATVDGIFDATRELRKKTRMPLVFMTYANVVFSYGTEHFIRTAAEAGADGLILSDVPWEEKEEFQPLCETYGLAYIPTIAPASGERTEKIVRSGDGFVYCVSSPEMTADLKKLYGGADAMASRVRKVRDIPCAVGLGMPTPEQAKAAAAAAGGVIVENAAARLCGQYGQTCASRVKEYIRTIKEAIREA